MHIVVCNLQARSHGWLLLNSGCIFCLLIKLPLHPIQANHVFVDDREIATMPVFVVRRYCL